jgi:ribulose bisphosphate carboxylase small subunit
MDGPLVSKVLRSMDLGTKFSIERIDRNGLWSLARMNIETESAAEAELARMLEDDPQAQLRIVRTDRQVVSATC